MWSNTRRFKKQNEENNFTDVKNGVNLGRLREQKGEMRKEAGKMRKEEVVFVVFHLYRSKMQSRLNR